MLSHGVSIIRETEQPIWKDAPSVPFNVTEYSETFGLPRVAFAVAGVRSVSQKIEREGVDESKVIVGCAPVLSTVKDQVKGQRFEFKAVKSTTNALSSIV